MALFRKPKRSAPLVGEDEAALIRASHLFDAGWYLLHNPDVAEARAEPALHYLRHGASEGRNPGPYFNTNLYLAANPDVGASKTNALIHYLRHGRDPKSQSKTLPLPRHRTHNDSQDDHSSSISESALELPGLFEGSTFGELSSSDPAEILRYMARSATPAEMLPRVDETEYSPLISIILPIYNTSPRFFREVVQSVLAQTYANWELCLADDGSSSPLTISIFDELAQSPDLRMKTVRLEQNRGIAGASQAALSLASGEFVAFLDHDDMLAPSALSEVVGSLRSDSAADFIYTDHVLVDQNGYPKYFAHKPAWSPEFLLSTNYIVHFKVVRRSLLQSIGGLENQTDNVQDLGVSCALVAAGARVRHLGKPVYLWREHSSSVALSSSAKPGIEGLLMQVYDRHFDQLGIPARQSWPMAFKATHTGVFQLEFTGDPQSVSLIIISRGTNDDEASIRERFAPVLAAHVRVHIISFEPADGHAIGTPIESDAALFDFIKSLDTDVVAFVSATTQYLGIDWLARLTSYVSMAPDIGAAGGKVLDPWLQVRSGGMLLDATGAYRTIAGGRFDNEAAHWFIGQVASNVDAVSSQLMATRRSTLIEMGGLQLHAFGDAAGVAYSAALMSRGYRIVYDPHSRCCDTGRLEVSESARTRIREIGLTILPLRTYQALGV